MTLEIEKRPASVLIWRVMQRQIKAYTNVPFLLRHRSPIAQRARRAAWAACLAGARFEARATAGIWLACLVEQTGLRLMDELDIIDAGRGWSLWSRLTPDDIQQLNADLDIERAELALPYQAPTAPAARIESSLYLCELTDITDVSEVMA